jgi:adenylosuccinate synthase
VPVGVVFPDCSIMIAAGSEVNQDVLQDELDRLDAAGFKASERLWVDATATVLDESHIETETGLISRIGSTGKGIGAARAARIMRTAELYGGPVDVMTEAQFILAQGGDVVIEGTQGYGLGLHAGWYPYCTSGDCRAIDFLAQVGITPWEYPVKIWMVARTRPIRVAGNSGPLKDETSWGALGLPDERTTVTNKVRRVGEWDMDLVMQAIGANGGPSPRVVLAITMLDQRWPEVAGHEGWTNLPAPVDRWLQNIENKTGTRIDMIGTGPTTGAWKWRQSRTN